MARKSGRTTQHVKPEHESQDFEEQEAPEATAPDKPGTVGESISKSEAIRRALAAGIDTPTDGAQYIRRVFGIEVTSRHFSATKARQKNRDSKLSTPVRRRQNPKVESEGGEPTPPPQTHKEGEGDLLNTLEALKPMIARHGAEKLKRMVDLLE